jgi:hypothetical protein
MTRRRVRIVRATVAAAAALAALLATAVSAASVPAVGASSASGYQPKNVTVPYDNDWTFISKPLKACMFIEASGTLKAHHRNAYTDGPNWFIWSNMRMEKPLIRVQTGSLAHVLTGTSCNLSKPVKLEQATVEQQWYEGDCKLSATVAAGLPWSIVVSPTHTCGNHKVADRMTAYRSGTKFAQHNSGYPVHYSGTLLERHDIVIQVRGNVSVTGYRKVHGVQVSDTFHTEGALADMDDCDGNCLGSG